MNRLKGKYILITGASQGLGRQMATDFAREGAAALSIVARRGDALNEVHNAIRNIAPQTRVLVITADLSREEEIERVVATTLNEFKVADQLSTSLAMQAVLAILDGARMVSRNSVLKVCLRPGPLSWKEARCA